MVAGELQATCEELVAAEPDGSPNTRPQLQAEWQGRIRRLLLARPDAVEDIRALLRVHAQHSEPTRTRTAVENAHRLRPHRSPRAGGCHLVSGKHAVITRTPGDEDAPMTRQRRAAVTKWALIVGNVMLGLLLTGLGLHNLDRVAGTYLSGEDTTAKVQNCIPPSSSKGSYRCSGTWRLAGGARGTGEIERTESVDEGKAVAVRATKTGAVKGDGNAVLVDSAVWVAVVGAGVLFLAMGPWKVSRLFAGRGIDRHGIRGNRVR